MSNKILFFSLLFLCMFLSVIPRSSSVVSRNYVFGFDQGRDYLKTRDIVVFHKLTLIGEEIGMGYSGIHGVFQGPFYFYLLAIPFIIFHGDPYGAVVLMFLLGLLSIAISFLLGKKLFGLMGGFVTVLLVAISPPLIGQSYFLWTAHSLSPFILLAFYFTYLSFYKKYTYLFLAAFFSGFIYNFEIGVAIPMCLTLLFYCIFILRFRNIKLYMFLFLGYFVAFLPMVIFETRHGFMGAKGVFSYIFHNHIHAAKIGHPYLADHLQTFIYSFYDTFPRQSTIPLLILIVIVFAFTILYIMKEKILSRKCFMLYLIISSPMAFFVFSFLKDAVYVYYLFGLNFVYILLFSNIIYSSFVNHNLFPKIIVSFLLVLFMVKALPDAVNTFIYSIHDYGGTAKVKGKIDAIDYIYKNASKKPFGVLVFSPPVYTFPYDYLLWWYGQQKYHYMPYNEKKGLVYLLIEPDPWKPWSYKGWLETVIKTGTVLETKQLSSGFIVQKRME